MKTVPLVGYSDKLSGRPGERINFMVSSEHKEDFTAELFRSISADPNPQGLGVVEQSCDEFFTKKSFLSRKQSFHPGSYAISEKPLKITAEDKISFSVLIYPTLQCANSQSIIEFGQFISLASHKAPVTARVGAFISFKLGHPLPGTVILDIFLEKSQLAKLLEPT